MTDDFGFDFDWFDEQHRVDDSGEANELARKLAKAGYVPTLKKQAAATPGPLGPELVTPSRKPDIPKDPFARLPSGGGVPSSEQPEPEQMQYREVVIDPNGEPRQAGADQRWGKFVKGFKQACEGSLYLFTKSALNRHFLTPELHKPVCEFIQKVPPFRKLVKMPREHAKTAIVSGGLPLHIIIQPEERNIYFPGLAGSECRILLSGETETMAKKNLRVLAEVAEGNKLFRALWPHLCWDKPRAQSKEWSATALIFPRKNEWPDQTIKAVGVGGAITGSRPNVLIKDDLISLNARNSQTVMDTAIEWHKVSRALLDSYENESGLNSLEFIIGTHWAVFDLYTHIEEHDPSVEIIDKRFHQIITDGRILWKEKHTLESIEDLRREYGPELFNLLYMNNALDSSMTDFDLESVRYFDLVHGDDGKMWLVFDEDDRDLTLIERAKESGAKEVPPITIGRKRVRLGAHPGRDEYIRLRYGR